MMIFEKFTNKEWVQILLLALIANSIGDSLSGVAVSVFPDSLSLDALLVWFVIARFIGYGITGVLLGFALNYLLHEKTKYILRWLPLVLLCAKFIVSYMNLFSAGRAGSWSAIGVLKLQLTQASGYACLFFMPFAASIMYWYLMSIRTGVDINVKNFIQWFHFEIVRAGVADSDVNVHGSQKDAKSNSVKEAEFQGKLLKEMHRFLDIFYGYGIVKRVAIIIGALFLIDLLLTLLSKIFS